MSSLVKACQSLTVFSFNTMNMHVIQVNTGERNFKCISYLMHLHNENKTKNIAVQWCVGKRERWAGRGINDVSIVFSTLHVIKTCFFHTNSYFSTTLLILFRPVCTYTKYTKHNFSFISTTAP